MKRWCLTILSNVCLFLIPAMLLGQNSQPGSIKLTNGSFEDVPKHSRQPSGWNDCGFAGETAPDTQPNNEFAVSKPAAHGMTYLGMVVRDNDTYESVSQRLSAPMVNGECYSFSIMLARSEMYVSLSRRTEEVVNYNTPAKLRVYGGFGHCDRRQLLAESKMVTNFEWSEFQFKLEPQSNFTYLVLEAYYDTPVLLPYNGNILVDGASELVPMGCATPIEEALSEEVVVNQAPAPAEPEMERDPARGNPEPVVMNPPTNPTPNPPAAQPNRTIENPTKVSELNRDNVRKGQTLRMDKLFFDADKASIRTGSEEALNDLYGFLRENPNVIIEIGGHTNGLPEEDYCDRLSTDRAKSVATYLRDRGIPGKQLEYKGYGKRYLIASDDTMEGRRKNQRVEIKILEVGERAN